MAISRIELADAGSPEKLVLLILKHEPSLSIPVPVEDLARQLDIADIHPLTTQGFEGGLLTDAERSTGFILVRENVFPPRERFTIAHELGHFLIPTHIPDQPGKFLCSRADLNRLAANEQDRRARMEVEANRFASLLLIPPPRLRQSLLKMGDPDLEHVPALAREYKVSKEAMARAYADYHEQPVAVVVVHNGRVLRSYRNRAAFPFIQVSSGEPVPAGSTFYRGPHQRRVASRLTEVTPHLWIEVKRGAPAPAVYEQVYAQDDEFALIMLHLDQPDHDAVDEESDLERRWKVTFR